MESNYMRILTLLVWKMSLFRKKELEKQFKKRNCERRKERCSANMKFPGRGIDTCWFSESATWTSMLDLKHQNQLCCFVAKTTELLCTEPLCKTMKSADNNVLKRWCVLCIKRYLIVFMSFIGDGAAVNGLSIQSMRFLSNQNSSLFFKVSENVIPLC